MRLLPLSLLLVLPLLAACDSSTPPKAPAANTPAATTPAKAPASTGKTPAATTAALPPGARPLLGTWAALDCSDKTGLTVISATSYSAGGKSCDIALSDNKDGTFAASCNKQTLKLTPIFGPAGEGIRIAAGDAKPATVFRCSK